MFMLIIVYYIRQQNIEQIERCCWNCSVYFILIQLDISSYLTRNHFVLTQKNYGLVKQRYFKPKSWLDNLNTKIILLKTTRTLVGFITFKI